MLEKLVTRRACVKGDDEAIAKAAIQPSFDIFGPAFTSSIQEYRPARLGRHRKAPVSPPPATAALKRIRNRVKDHAISFV